MSTFFIVFMNIISVRLYEFMSAFIKSVRFFLTQGNP